MDKIVIVTSFASEYLINKYKNEILIGVENGINKILNLKLKPSVCISDFDTINYDKICNKDLNIIKLPCEKDFSDTEEAIKKAIELYNVKEIIILCSLEKRYDHSHSLLLLLKKYKDYDIKLIDDNNLIKVLSNGKYLIKKDDYKYLGVFGFPKGVLSISGVKYDVNNYYLDFCETRAISNDILDDEIEINVISGDILLTLSKD